MMGSGGQGARGGAGGVGVAGTGGRSGAGGAAGATGTGGSGGGGTCTRNPDGDSVCTMPSLTQFYLCTGNLTPARCMFLYAGDTIAAYCCP
jgi:hypothetical protein